ncbi:MAG: hypothetical protein H6Q70_142 [Firmicutes bacterium]|nr:hypothetical protein [Bacillota bacterium]
MYLSYIVLFYNFLRFVERVISSMYNGNESSAFRHLFENGVVFMSKKYVLKYAIVDFNAKIMWLKLENVYLVDPESLERFKLLIIKNKYLVK